MNEKGIKEVRTSLELLLALEKIEYHNKNWLASEYIQNPKKFSEEKQYLLEKALSIIGTSAKTS